MEVIMRFFTVAAMMLLSVGANAFDPVFPDAIVARDLTCSDIKTLVRHNGEMTIIDQLGDWQVYMNGVACAQQGMISEFKAMRAKDKWCVVGLVCDPYFGGM
jgi:hypothetical protein